MDETSTDFEVLSAFVSAHRDITDRLRNHVLGPLYQLAKVRSLAQLACCFRLQRTIDVQSKSLELVASLGKALGQLEQRDVGTDSDKAARRTIVGKMQQVCDGVNVRDYIRSVTDALVQI